MPQQIVRGFEVSECDPAEGDTCQWDCQQKIGGRWKHAACGRPAYLSLHIGRVDQERIIALPLCRRHMRALAVKAVDCLVEDWS